MLFGVRTTIGQEKVVSELLENKAKKEGFHVYSVIFIDSMRGYLFIEAENEGEARRFAYKVPHVKGLVKGSMTFDEIKHFLEVKPMTAGIKHGDIVEITSGAFKGEKARVVRVDESKDKITVEIIEAVVPIPITVNASNVRVVTNVEKN